MPAGEDVVTSDIDGSNNGVAYRHDGWSSTTLQSLTFLTLGLGGAHRDISFDQAGNFMYSYKFSGTNITRRNVGFTSVAESSVNGPASNIWGMCHGDPGFINTFLTNDTTTNTIYRHAGFTTTILASWSSGRTQDRGMDFVPTGLWAYCNSSWDDGAGGADQWNADLGTLIKSVTNGLTFTVTGEGWDDTNSQSIFSFLGSWFIRRYVGFTRTFDSDITPPGTTPRALCSWRPFGEAGTRRMRHMRSVLRRKC